MLLCLVQGLKETAERMNTDHKEIPASYHYHQPNKNIIMWWEARVVLLFSCYSWKWSKIIIKVFIKHKILSIETILSAYMHMITHRNRHRHTHTHTHTHTQTHECTGYTKLHLHTTSEDKKQRLEAEEDSSAERKTLQVYVFGKRTVLRFYLKASSEDFCQRGRGRSFHVEEPDRKSTNQQWRVRYKESGNWEYQKQSRQYGRVCKIEDSHRDKTEQCTFCIYNRQCQTQTKWSKTQTSMHKRCKCLQDWSTDWFTVLMGHKKTLQCKSKLCQNGKC